MRRYFNNNSGRRRLLSDELIARLCRYLYQFDGVTSVFIDLEFKDGTEINVLHNQSSESIETMNISDFEEKDFDPGKYFKD